jgi:hypothetical protein
MTNNKIKKFFKNIELLELSRKDKLRMMNLIQVRGSNKKNKVMSYNNFIFLVNKNKSNIISLTLGPKWNRLVFVDIDTGV